MRVEADKLGPRPKSFYRRDDEWPFVHVEESADIGNREPSSVAVRFRYRAVDREGRRRDDDATPVRSVCATDSPDLLRKRDGWKGEEILKPFKEAKLRLVGEFTRTSRVSSGASPSKRQASPYWSPLLGRPGCPPRSSGRRQSYASPRSRGGRRTRKGRVPSRAPPSPRSVFAL